MSPTPTHLNIESRIRRDSNMSMLSNMSMDSSKSFGTTTGQLINRLRETERQRDLLADELLATNNGDSIATEEADNEGLTGAS